MSKTKDGVNPIIFEVIRNRLVAITDEMRVALQSVSGSPTVTEASDFFTGLFTAAGEVASMGFQVAYQAPVCGAFIRHIQGRPRLGIGPRDMFIGNDPYVAALHQNDVQMVGPIFIGDRLVAWAGVEAHETDVGGMDFASWSPKAREVYQEGLRIPCVKLIDDGEIRDDVLEMILTASRLPGQLGLDIRAFIATINVARDRMNELAGRYGSDVVADVMEGMIASSEARMRERLRGLPDGVFHAADFLEHDGHQNALYKLDVRLTKKGDELELDFSGSSPQAPGFINATRSGLMGAITGSVMPTLGFDIQWNEGLIKPIRVIAPDGMICTATFPSPAGAATVEAIWVTANAIMLALNKLIAASETLRHRAQGLSHGVMSTFNMGGVNQFGENFGLHLMDPLGGGSAAFPDKDGVNAGGPITSPVSAVADIERNEQVAPLFYLYRRLACDTGGPGKFRGGLSAEVAFSLGGVKQVQALVMTHGVEVPNSRGVCGGLPGATVVQRFAKGGMRDGRAVDADYTVFGPKPGLMPMTDRDVFAVSWQGGGGYGDPLERDPELVLRDVARGHVSASAARSVYGVVCAATVDEAATNALRREMRQKRIGGKTPAGKAPFRGEILSEISSHLHLGYDERGYVVVTSAGAVLSVGDTRWRSAAVAERSDSLPPELRIKLHEQLVATRYYCPLSGALLAVDVHERDTEPVDDVILDLDVLEERRPSRIAAAAK